MISILTAVNKGVIQSEYLGHYVANNGMVSEQGKLCIVDDFVCGKVGTGDELIDRKKSLTLFREDNHGKSELYKLVHFDVYTRNWRLRNIKTGVTSIWGLGLRNFTLFRTLREARARADERLAEYKKMIDEAGFKDRDFIKLRNPIEFVTSETYKRWEGGALFNRILGVNREQTIVFKATGLHKRDDNIIYFDVLDKDNGHMVKEDIPVSLFERVEEEDIEAINAGLVNFNRHFTLERIKDEVGERHRNTKINLTSQLIDLSVAYRRNDSELREFWEDSGEQALGKKLDSLTDSIKVLIDKGVISEASFDDRKVSTNIVTHPIVINKIFDLHGDYGVGDYNRENSILKENIELGKFNILIDFVTNQIRVSRLDWNRGSDEDRFNGNHPHISDSGYMCFGQLQDEIFNALKKMDLEYLVTAIVATLEGVNIGDTLIPFKEFVDYNEKDYINITKEDDEDDEDYEDYEDDEDDEDEGERNDESGEREGEREQTLVSDELERALTGVTA